jgi:integrase
MSTTEVSTYPLCGTVPLTGQMGEHRVNGLAPDATEVKPMAPEETLPTLEKPKRVDLRSWEKHPKLGTRLRRQAGSKQGNGNTESWLFQSRTPDPERPGRDRIRNLRARNWTEARRVHEERSVNVRKGLEAPPTTKTVDELAEEHWQHMEGLIATGERAPGTLERYRIQYRTHIAPSFGSRKVQVAFRPEMISRWLAEKRKQGLDVASIYSVLSVLISRALKSRLIAEDPRKRLLDGEIPAQVSKQPPRCLSDEECSQLIGCALPGTRDLIAFYAETGVRQSEGLGVKWGDLDLEQGLVRIHSQLERKKRGESARNVPLKTARRKNGCREREIELPDDLVVLLKRRKAEAFKAGHARPEDFVFSTEEGRPLMHRNLSRDFDKAAGRAGLNREGIPELSCHDLRHTTISRWIAAGIDTVTVALWAGDDLKTILSTYAHEFEKAKRRDENRAKLEAGRTIRLA